MRADMTEVATRCPACLSRDIQGLVDRKLITFLFPVPQHILAEIDKERISINVCNSCSHVYQVNVKKRITDKIYSKLYEHYNLDTSAEFQRIYRDRTVGFINDKISQGSVPREGGKKPKMLDVGCGEGTYFPHFEELGYDCYGFEPSVKSEIAARENPRTKISYSYFEDHDSNIFDTKFDVILLNWVLEHVLSLDEFFVHIERYCRASTKIIFQVPDLLYYVKHGLYLFYVHEHIHYFTPFSISKCLGRFGFGSIEYKNSDCPSLLVSAEYTGKSIDLPNSNDSDQSISNISDFIRRGDGLGGSSNKVFADYKEIYFYGVGTSTYWLGEFFLSDDIKKRVRIIDDNEFYCGKLVPSFSCPITGIENVSPVSRCVFFIGTSPVYRDIIMRKIGEQVATEYDVVFIEGNEFRTIRGHAG